MPAIRADDEIRKQFFVLQAHTDDTLLALYETGDSAFMRKPNVGSALPRRRGN